MASISTTGSKAAFELDRRGFTLVELMIAAVLSALVFASIFSAYLFMARNLTRLANSQQQLEQSRRVFRILAQDVSNAVQLTTPPTPFPTLLELTMQSPTNPNTVWAVRYVYDTNNHWLNRVDTSTNTTVVVLSNLTTTPTFKFYNQSGAESSAFIKQVQLVYSSAVGSLANGTRSSNDIVSARWILRNKTATGQ